jgi:predicted PurR-regulated permease PerM
MWFGQHGLREGRRGRNSEADGSKEPACFSKPTWPARERTCLTNTIANGSARLGCQGELRAGVYDYLRGNRERWIKTVWLFTTVHRDLRGRSRRRLAQTPDLRRLVLSANPSQGGNRGSTVLTVLIVVAVLYFARVVFVPLALAVLLAFMLAPLVDLLRRCKLGRTPSSILVVLLSFLILGTIGAVMVSQLADLGRKLPEYEQNVHRKLESLRASGGGLVTRATHVARNLTDELNIPGGASSRTTPGEEKPVPVEIRRSPFSPMEMVQSILSSIVSVVLTAGIVIVFVIFMLIQQDDLRDRLLRLAGAGRISMTTRVLADAGSRVSRYLLAQLMVNSIYGVMAGLGLYFFGIPNPLLWGMMATLLRYVPYLGIWIAASMPAAVCFAVEPGWVKLPGILGLYFGIDLMMYNFVEPLLYGSSTGVSPLAILLATVFWTWLWGPVGLLLATPLTVCVVVIGRHVPKLNFLGIMFSDEPVLGTDARFYQRLLAMDMEEAAEIADKHLRKSSLGALYDEVIIPALSLAEEDRHQGRIDEERQRFLFQNTQLILEDAAGQEDAPGESSRGAASHAEAQAPADVEVLCLPARDEADGLAALMLAQLLGQQKIKALALSEQELVQEQVLERVKREKPRIVCVLAIPPFGYMHARYLCRRLHEEFRELKIVATILNERNVEEIHSRQPAIPADCLASSLRQAAEEIRSLSEAAGSPAQGTALDNAA